MQKAALVALPYFSIGNLSTLLQMLTYRHWKIRTLSLTGKSVMTAEGIQIKADASLTETVPLDFDLMILPGGRYASEVWNDIQFHRFLRQYDGQRHWFAATQEGVICLAAAGLLGGVMYSLNEESAESYAHILAHAIYRRDSITVDANVVSSNGDDPLTFAQVVCQRMELHL